MSHPEWFQEILLGAAHVAFTSEFWDEIDREREDLPDGAPDNLPAYGPGTELCGYTDEIPKEDLAKIADCFDRMLKHYHGCTFWELVSCVFDVDESKPYGSAEQRGSTWYRIYDAVGSHFLGMLGHGVDFWDDELPDAQEKAEEKFPRLREPRIYNSFDDVPYAESLLEELVDKHRATIAATLPTGDSLRRRPRQPR